MSRWNGFGRMLTVPIFSWTAGALIFWAGHAFAASYFMGSCALLALIAQHQWGRA